VPPPIPSATRVHGDKDQAPKPPLPWLCLAVVIDLFSRRVVGRALAEHMRVDLVEAALAMTARRRTPPPGLIHHSDREPVPIHACQARLAEHDMLTSMRGKGDCWDNAPVEGFFGSLEREGTDHVLYPTRNAAKADVIASIEMFYASHRRQSYLGYVSPYAAQAGA